MVVRFVIGIASLDVFNSYLVKNFDPDPGKQPSCFFEPVSVEYRWL
jgi:hypothetical protein